jgi:hypothetical protein
MGDAARRRALGTYPERTPKPGRDTMADVLKRACSNPRVSTAIAALGTIAEDAILTGPYGQHNPNAKGWRA